MNMKGRTVVLFMKMDLELSEYSNLLSVDECCLHSLEGLDKTIEILELLVSDIITRETLSIIWKPEVDER